MLSEEQGVFSLGNSDGWILSPAPNDSLTQAFKDFMRQGYAGASEWNDAMGTGGFDPPRVNGTDWDLVYYYPSGLYIDYEIREAYYFPGTGYLLLFTHQDMLATGMDTMHGFMILRLNLSEE